MARPKGAKDKAPRVTAAAKQAQAAASEGLTPLEFMLGIIRDKNQEMSLRADMAKAAAPYIHPRLSNVEHKGEGGGAIKVSVVRFDHATE